MRAPALLLTALCLLGPAPIAAAQTSSKGYIEMPLAEDGAWVLTSPPGKGRNWGRPVFVRYLAMVAQEWKRRHPEGPVMRIGDMSKPDGSNFPPHKTHKDGLTADLFTRPKNICHVRYPNQKLTLEYAQLLYDYGARQILYNGSLVTKTLAVAKKWPKHDDHFHIVIDPKRVPAEGALLVFPAAQLKSGGWIPATGLDKDRKGLELAWRVLGQAKLKHYRVLFDDARDDNGVLHDSGPLRKRGFRYRLPLALEHGKTYRWKVELVTKGKDAQPAGFGWQTLQSDLELPTIGALAPAAEAQLDAAPRFAWSYGKRLPQVRYWIDLDRDRNHRKIGLTLGPFASARKTHLLTKRLRKGKRYYWRVRAADAHGNVGASEWRRFKTSQRYGKGPKPGPEGGSRPASRVGSVNASALNMRQGPGTKHPVVTTLKRGTRVRVLKEEAGWLHVETLGAGTQRGYVSKRFVDLP